MLDQGTTRNAERERIIELMKKLARITVERGASEQEAVFAANKLAALKEEWDVQQDELTIRTDAAGMLTDFYTSFGSYRDNARWTSVASAISQYTHTKVWLSYQDIDLGMGLGVQHSTDIKFFGYPLDVATAVSLTSIAFTAITGESQKYGKELRMRQGSKKRRDLIHAFQYGMAQRLAERILDMIQRYKASSSTALIPLKDQLVTEEYARLNLKLRSAVGYSGSVDGAAMARGRAAGDRVNLNMHNQVNDRGASNGNTQRRIR